MLLSIAEISYIGIFIGSFLSYSIVPFPIEAAIITASQLLNPYLLFFLALIGATLGSITNYFIGLKGVSRFLPNPESRKMKNANKLAEKFGPPSLIFLTWLPIIGDPIIIATGALKMNFKKFLLYSTLAKIWYLALIINLGPLLPQIL